VALICEPVAAARALRDAEAAVTREEAARSQSERAGFVETTRRRMRADAVSERERELADGHALLRVSGYVTVHAETLERLEQASGEVLAAAAQSGLELRLMAGRQVEALSFTGVGPVLLTPGF
jgi:hypothetical protein